MSEDAHETEEVYTHQKCALCELIGACLNYNGVWRCEGCEESSDG